MLQYLKILKQKLEGTEMKRWMTLAGSMTLAVSLTVTSFAMTRGTVVVRDEYYDDEITVAQPGQTVYVGICSDPSSSRDDPEKAYLFEAETINSDTGEDDELFGSRANKSYSEKGTGGQQLDIVRREISDGEYYYFAVLEIEEADDPPADGYDVFPGIIRVTRENGDIFDVTPKLERIGFEEGDDALEEDPLSFSFDKDDDVEIEFPDGDGYFYGTAKKDGAIVAGMSTDDDSSITRRYPNASLRFYYGNGASLTALRSPKIYIEADEDDYLYEVTGSNTLTNRTSSYDEDEGGFVLSSNTLGKYIVSDTRLTAGSASYDEDDDDDDDVDYNQPAYVVPVNPSTGAQP